MYTRFMRGGGRGEGGVMQCRLSDKSSVCTTNERWGEHAMYVYVYGQRPAWHALQAAKIFYLVKIALHNITPS